jgi:hypothetical protein
MTDKAQSEVLGIVLLLALSMTTIGMIFAFGLPSVNQANDILSDNRIENEFSLLDSRVASTALGASEGQSLSMSVDQGTLAANPNGSYINITQEYAPGSTYDNRTLANVSIGYIRHEKAEGGSIAYEGGGVWKQGPESESTVMVSPPEFYYEGRTLTLPVFDIVNRTATTGERSGIQVNSAGDVKTLFPDPEYTPGPDEEDKDNPLDNGSIFVTVKSDYYQGWVKYFRSRTETNVTSVDESENKAKVRLEVPIAPPELDKAGVYEDSCTQNGALDCDDNFESLEQGSLPSADEYIRNTVDAARSQAASDPDAVWDRSCGSNCDEPLYYADGTTGSLTIDGETFDVDSNNVTVAVDNQGAGDLTINEVNIDNWDNNSVERLRILATGDITFNNGARNTDSKNSSKMIVYTESGNLVDFNGNQGADAYGVLYAPGSEVNLNGAPGWTWYGTIAAGEITNNGNPGDFREGSSVDLRPGDTDDPITYLHVTENRVRVR